MKQKDCSPPGYIAKYFWGDNLRDLSWTKHKKYIIQTILEKGNQPAAKWLLTKVDKKYLKSLLPKLTLSPKSNNFWSLYLK